MIISGKGKMSGMLHRKSGRIFFPSIFILSLSLWAGLFSVARGDDMRGPAPLSQRDVSAAKIESSPVKLAMRGTIRFYQIAVSRVNPDRCGFRPSCSRFAAMSIEEYGAPTGMMMAADRLMRCNTWKRPGPNYLLLPGGKLLDPPSQNLLEERPGH